jgi:uncharacterized Zn finger protein
MTAIAAYLRLASVKARTRAADFRLGREIAAQGEVEIVEREPDRILAKAGRKDRKIQRRQVELRATAAGFVWRCSCTTKRDLFCKHCVAAALTAMAEMTALTINVEGDFPEPLDVPPSETVETESPR